MSDQATATGTRQRVRHPQAVGKLVDSTERGRRFVASYDAAQTNTENALHWAAADALSANSANSASVRSILRFRSRYEYANNTYCQGMLLTLANDTVGEGPRLQIPLTGRTLQQRRARRRIAQQIEAAFHAWAEEIRLAEKIWRAVLTRRRDGEVFLVAINNPKLRSPVKLDIQLIEADQVSTPALELDPSQPTDGIVFDRYGNPMAYHILKTHPGEQQALRIGSLLDFDIVDARQVAHFFRCDRPGQKRGVPEITAALPLYALLRRYTLAVVSAAETAADIAGVIKTNAAPEDEDATFLDPMDLVDIVRRMLMVLPEGYDATQFKAEQPTTTYAEFKRELINEIARVLNMPFNIAAGNSNKYNYASGRLDHQVYFKMLRIERRWTELNVLDFVLGHWLAEASRIAGYLPIPDADLTLPHKWRWPGTEHVDPLKEAAADDVRLKNRSKTYARYYADQGLDWEEEFEQAAIEEERMVELGITPEWLANEELDRLQRDDDSEPTDGDGEERDS